MLFGYRTIEYITLFSFISKIIKSKIIHDIENNHIFMDIEAMID